MGVKISIIIPVFNAEKYLRDTFKSIQEQLFHDYEVVAVNDGSTDASLSILLELSKTDSRIQVIDKINTGVSDTRNVAIQAATGEYVCFLDADDYLSPDYLSHMYQIAEEQDADMIVCNYTPFRGTPIFSKRKADPVFVQSSKTLNQAGVLTSACTKLIKNTILSENSIQFDTNMSFGEDLFFCWKAFLASKNVWMIDEPLYGYRMTDSGATRKFHEKLYEKYRQAFKELKEFSNKEHEEMDLFFATRMPSFLRMTIRDNTKYSEKVQRINEILSDDIISAMLSHWDEFEKLIKPSEVKFYQDCRDKKAEALLRFGYINEWKSKLSVLKSKLMR